MHVGQQVLAIVASFPNQVFLTISLVVVRGLYVRVESHHFFFVFPVPADYNGLRETPFSRWNVQLFGPYNRSNHDLGSGHWKIA